LPRAHAGAYHAAVAEVADAREPESPVPHGAGSQKGGTLVFKTFPPGASSADRGFSAPQERRRGPV